ncbi:MAG: tyrosine-protein phosphatase [Microbacterium sp.]|uniref:tyrosine-protein phosphatase n=1 Tax=Microbacterium sp. TaxID=51671 RepID=UPI001ACCA3F3|nr:tyrosine-protein phosphatase [Microbacterium sp.]MBN9176553.1 tyrosine-protein phosphatase [Microbacterium sp.]
MSTIARHLDLEGAFNARAFFAASSAQPWLVRSSALHELTPAGAEVLRAFGVVRVIDLREPGEGAAGAHEIEVAALPVYRFPGNTVPIDGNLEQLMQQVIETRGEVLAEIVDAVASAEGPVAVHCTIGKDRTGLIVALVLSAAGATEADIIADYALSGDQVYPHRREYVEQMLASRDLGEREIAEAWRLNVESPAEVMEYILALLRAEGGAAEYLRAHGLSAHALAALRARSRAFG